MKCPICGNRHQVEIDTHSDGFAENLQECGHCGALWTRKGERVIVLHESCKAVR
jgi:uncharacterized Zn finger protein